MDEREKLYSMIARDLVSVGLDASIASRVMDTIAVNLDKFEVQSRSTELAEVLHDSDEIVYMYLCTLLSEGKSQRTVNVYANTIRLFLNECNKEIREVSTFDIRAWLARVQTRASKRTAENYRSYLSSLFTWCEAEGVISENPMKRIKPVKCEDVKREAFTSIEVDLLRCATNNEAPLHRAIVEVLLSSGVRVEELCDLRKDDIDYATLTINVSCGKGGKQRTTILSPLAVTCLKRYLDSRTDDLEWLFVTSHKPYTKTNPGNIRKMLKRVGFRCGISDIHPHKFRRTFATNAARMGMPMQELQELMGHANLNTTRLYVSVPKAKFANSYERYGR